MSADGLTLVVGAYNEDYDADWDNALENAGAVYVFSQPIRSN